MMSDVADVGGGAPLEFPRRLHHPPHHQGGKAVIFTKTKDPKHASSRDLVAIDADLLAWRSRREQLGVDLEDARARRQRAVEQRGQASAALVPDEKAVRQARSEHTAVTAELEELELAVAAVEERLCHLAGEHARAERRRVIAVTLASLDRLGAIAARLDADWDRVRVELERFIHAADDAAVVLTRACPGQSFALHPARLRGALLWRIGDLIDLGYVGAPERISVLELARWGRIREHLEHELANLANQEGARA